MRPHFLLLALLSTALTPIHAQTPASTKTQESAEALAKSAATTQKNTEMKAVAPVSPKPIEIVDMAAWKTIGTASISQNGKWAAWRLSEADGDSTVVVKALDGKEEYSFASGQGSGAIEFSADGQWLAFPSYLTKKEQETAKKAKKPIQAKLSLVDLKSGKVSVIEKVRKFAFAREHGGWIAIQKSLPEGSAVSAPPASAASSSSGTAAPSTAPKGSDLLLKNLSTGAVLNLGAASEFEFDKQGRYLAYLIDAADKAGNAIVVHSLDTSTSKVLDDGEANYEKLSWNDKGSALTVLKGVEDKAYQDKLWSVLGFKLSADKSFSKTLVDPAKLKDFPAEMTISPDAQTRWSDDFAWISFGIKETKKKNKEEKKDADSDEKVNLVLWHAQDKRLPTQQKVQQDADKKRSSAALYWVREEKFVRLGDEKLNAVNLPQSGYWALGQDDSAYQRQGSMDGRRFSDVYAIDLRNGERRLLKKQASWTFEMSLDGKHYLHYEDGDFFSIELATGKAHNLTAGLPTSFVNVEDDHNLVKPPVAPFGWSADSRFALLSDGWDIWKIPVDGGKAVQVTSDGKRDQVRYQRRYNLDPDEKAIDLTKPQYFSAYGEWNKKAGFLLLDANGEAKRLAFDDVSYRRLLKAEKKDVFLLAKETENLPPDLYVSNARLSEPRQLSHLGEQEKNYTLGRGAMLVDYVGTDGKKLQGALFLPANYQPGKSYPTIVYIYEKLSQGLHNYVNPTVGGGGFNRAFYTSHGYAVFNPDITYRVNDPGVSAKESVLPALNAAIATGVVDQKRVGLQGHSWGGYQTAFLITQTNVFKAAAAGAALTNMISMYSLVYKNSGSTNQAIFESSQGRFLGTYNDHWEAYVRNSPVFFAKNVQTPLLMLQNDADGAVDYTQGVEYFNTLRRAGKDVIMLEYPGENHGLVKKPNQKDYMMRMKEFFDFHLKGQPAPEWITQGVAWLKMDEHLKARASLVNPPAESVDTKATEGKDNTSKEPVNKDAVGKGK